MTISGDVHSEDQGVTTLGIEYGGEGVSLRIKVAGRMLHKLSELAPFLPLVVLHQESHRVLTEGPDYRRRFLDWGLFHVEPHFLSAWQRYRRALRQRNAMLQQFSDHAQIWDAELVESGTVIETLRQRYLQRFLPLFHEFLQLLLSDMDINVAYQPGWNDATDLATQLKQAIPGDRRSGYTRFGPHRADLLITLEGTPVREILSRGQLKMLAYTLMLSQAATFTDATGKRCVVLIDDLAAELDDYHIPKLLEKIQQVGFQTFITASEGRITTYLNRTAHKLFHVEHGRVKEVV